MSYTTIPGENVATPVESAASTPSAPNRRKQIRRGALFAAAGVLAALAVVSVHDRYSMPPHLHTPVDMRRYPVGFPYALPTQPNVAPPADHPSLRMSPRVAMMHEASQRFSSLRAPMRALVPPPMADPRAMRMHPRMTMMREASARFVPSTPFGRYGAARPFPHPALYNRAETAPPMRQAPPMVARGAMYDPRMMRGLGAVPPPMHFGERPSVARGYDPLSPPMPMQPEQVRVPVGAPHFVHNI